MAQNKYITASFMITPEQKKVLEKQAEKEERSVSFIVRKALEIGLKCLNEKQGVTRTH